ncbi:MAG: MFS transporter [Clostridia bacterium]|nr:MFS transporter [Clostridia bacterium]
MLAWFTRGLGNPAIIFVVEFLYGLGLAGMASVQSNILPDVTDVDEMLTGQRREGVVSTFSTFVKKFVSGFAAFGVGKILTAFGYDTALKGTEQSARAVFGVSICYTLVPVCFLILAFIVICTYNLTREKHSLIKEKIAFKHEHGYADVTEEEKRMLEKISGVKFEDMWLGKRETEKIEQ